MRWQRDGFVVAASQERGQPLPDWVIEEPILISGDAFYMKAFSELSTCRQIGMSLGPIPWRDMLLYAQYHCLDSFTIDLFISIIKAMDTFYLDWHRKEQERNNKQ